MRTMESLEQLHVWYRRSLHGKRDDLRQAWQQLCAEGAGDVLARDMHRRLHQLHGSAGAYGYDHIGALARLIERRLVRWLAQPPAERLPLTAVCAELDASMTAMLDALSLAGNEP